MAASRLATNLLLLVYRVRLQAHLRPRCAGDIARGPKRLVTLADYVKCDNERTALAIYKGSTGECAEAPFGHFEGFAMGGRRVCEAKAQQFQASAAPAGKAPHRP